MALSIKCCEGISIESNYNLKDHSVSKIGNINISLLKTVIKKPIIVKRYDEILEKRKFINKANLLYCLDEHRSKCNVFFVKNIVNTRNYEQIYRNKLTA